jgi:uncharacterized circularly permuted ATP-grasp superfamily protein
MQLMSEPMLARQPAAYSPGGFFDEVFAPGGSPRPHAVPLAFELARLGADHLAAAGRLRDTAFVEQGITFEADEDGHAHDRPFPLDLVPRIIPAAEWTDIKRGLAQRIRALNHFVDAWSRGS